MSAIQHLTAKLFSGILLVIPALSGCSDEAIPAEPPDSTAGERDAAAEQETITPDDPPAAKVEAPATPEKVRGPRLVFRPRGRQYGWQLPEPGTAHTFELSTGGSEALVIESILGRAGCVVSGVLVESADGEMETYRFGSRIPPGLNIHVLTELRAEENSCNQGAQVTVVSNDPRGSFRIGVAGDIAPFFTIRPRFLNFGRVMLGEAPTGESLITANDSIPFRLEIVEHQFPPGLSIGLLPVDAGRDGRATTWKLTATLGPDLAEGNHAHSLTLTSDVEIPVLSKPVGGSALVYQAQLSVSAEVLGDFSSSPLHVSLGLFRSGQVVTRTVKVECHDSQFSLAEQLPTVRIVGLQIPATSEFGEWEYADCFTTLVRPVDGENAVEIEVYLQGLPESAKGSFRGTLVIDLKHPRRTQITKVITGVCR